MMRAFAWLGRLGRGAARPPAAPADSSAAPTTRAPQPNDAALAPADAAAQAADHEAPAFGARRPLLASSGEVAGFEFRLAESVEKRMLARADAVSHSAHLIALLSAVRPTVESGRIGLVSVPAAMLEREPVATGVPAGAMLLVDALDPASVAQRSAIEGLRARGVKVGLALELDAAGHAPEIADDADFAVLAVGDSGIDGLLVQAAAWHAARPDRPIVAIDLPDIEAIERALKQDVAYASGRVDAHGAAREIKPLKAGAQRICKMLNDVVLDRDTALIAADIRADVGLSYRMLRYVNSPALGLGRRVESIEQAMTVLGRNELYRWLSVLLLGAGDGRRASRALQEISLARARLLELLARERGDAPDSLFTVGLLSLLDAMLQVPLDKALQPLNLGESARDALLAQAGPWQPYLALAAALERHDTEAIESLADGFGGAERVLKLSDQAWRWAAELGQSMREQR